MKKEILGILLILIIVFLAGCLPKGKEGQKLQYSFEPEKSVGQKEDRISLPQPKVSGKMSLEEAILKRRSKRDFLDKALSLEEISQILWSAQGITDSQKGFRSAPSAGALYPLEIYLVVGENQVGGLESGAYHYLPKKEQIERMLTADLRTDLAKNSLNQNFITQAPISLIIAADFSRTTGKYEDRGKQYVYLEAGHAAQNIYLQATALGLGTVTVGAFDDQGVGRVISLPESQTPIYVMPIGYPR